MLRCAVFLLCVFAAGCVIAENLPRTEYKDIPYYSETAREKADDYQKSQCKVKISVPKETEGAKLPVLVWFHGGGLTGGSLEYPGGGKSQTLIMNEKIILIGAGYRLSPKADFPAFIEDAAAATAWTFANIEKYGGDTKKIFIGGMSAGGYLSGMVGLDPQWLAPYKIVNKKLAGIIIQSGQVTTHYHVKAILPQKYPKPRYQPVIDENAPLFYLSKDAPPILLTTGDRELDMPARVQENELMYASLKALEHPSVEFYEHKGYDHGKVASSPESFERIKNFIKKTVPAPPLTE
ncbi:MAG: alpha/beta hydrolase [Planctomycetaceae bacterium]|jgi:acetyl esterase/lipase|nr:alpha/beta hydrolase [Planctomycetaceae bacterium]